MKVAIRADASLRIGTGHIMRCLTLAEALTDQSHHVVFMCRPHEGHLVELIRKKGFDVDVLAAPNTDSDHMLFHSDWLGATQDDDAKQCEFFLSEFNPDWLIVDHYAINQIWQEKLRPYCNKIMVIDDLGDRELICDLLLDQNYATPAKKYQTLVPKKCQILTGTVFALLRPEFSEWREYSIQRRANSSIKKMIVTLGGTDPDNFTGRVLKQLAKTDLSDICEITVIMGETAPHLQEVKFLAEQLSVQTIVKTNVSNMAELMANADIAIGAAGSTTWERCSLGLPTIQIVIAENQLGIAKALNKIAAIKHVTCLSQIPKMVESRNLWVSDVRKNCQELVPGHGTELVVKTMEKM